MPPAFVLSAIRPCFAAARKLEIGEDLALARIIPDAFAARIASAEMIETSRAREETR
jgi:hypothetical protein